MSRISDFNDRVAVKITNTVGTMYCAYLFAGISLISLPSAIKSHSVLILVSWLAQTFLQLVLLSIIIVGQQIQSRISDAMQKETHDTVIETRTLVMEQVANVHAGVKDLHRKFDGEVSE